MRAPDMDASLRDRLSISAKESGRSIWIGRCVKPWQQLMLEIYPTSYIFMTSLVNTFAIFQTESTPIPLSMSRRTST